MNHLNKLILSGITIVLLFMGCSILSSDKESDTSYLNPDLSAAERAADLVSKMTLEEKIGQMTQVERSVVELTTIKDNFLGSILNGGGSVPGDTPEDWTQMYDEFQRQALATRLKIPIIYGTDAVHGHNNLKGAVIFPHNIGLGATRNPELVQEIGRITALETAATGVDWTFAPAIPIVRDDRWGRTYESFGETSELAELLGTASIRGLQGNDLSAPETIAACAKHFIGDGGTLNGEDQGNTVASEAELRELHLPAYVDAIEANVATVMASYSSWNGNKVHGSSYLLTDLLKEELGFEGFVISDWGAIDQLPGDYSSDVERAINAGVDMVMVPYDYELFISTLTKLVQDGDVTEERIDDAVSRILKVKFELGLFEAPYSDPSLTSFIGSQGHRDVARQAVRESLVLLKNNSSVLPLSKNLNIHLAGKNADDLGHQMGGWSIWWQGGSGDLTEGTSIFEGFQSLSNASVSISATGNDIGNADIGIAVIGETPYAEGAGDRDDLRISREDVQVVKNLKASGKPVVVILVSGRPLILDEIMDDADAIVGAWLPGTEGDGVAEIIYGDFNPTGVLPVSWPRSNSQLPINIGDSDYDPLFEYGFGLSY